MGKIAGEEERVRREKKTEGSSKDLTRARYLGEVDNLVQPTTFIIPSVVWII